MTSVVAELTMEHLLLDRNIRVTVASNSMAPTIRAGDRAIVRRLERSGLTRGDIIVYQRGTTLCMHRFVRYDDRGAVRKIITKGDGLICFDESFNEDKVVGKVIAVSQAHKKVDFHRATYRLLNKAFVKILVFQWMFFDANRVFKAPYNVGYKRISFLVNLSCNLIGRVLLTYGTRTTASAK